MLGRWVCLSVMLFALSCSTPSSPGETGDGASALPCEPTLESVRSTIISTSCATADCHDADEPAAAMDLSVADLEAALVGVSSSCEGLLVIAPGDREASQLYRKVAGTSSCGLRMPVDGPLADHQIECIGAWIDSIEGPTCETCGGDVCVDTMADPLHCGGCDQPCPAGVGCSDGVCECPAGTLACAGNCVDPASDPQHCGGCDSPCAGGEFCLDGACGTDCGGLSTCGSACVDTTTNPLHCGACDTPCPAGSMCENSACACGPSVSFAATVEPILDGNCTDMGCHRATPGPMGMAKEDLDLRSGMAYGQLVGVPSEQCTDGRLRVAPGDPTNSYLMHKLNGTDLCFGTQMPKMGQSLPAADKQAISAWICQGALMN